MVGEVRVWLIITFGAAGFVLLIACANVANLVLARSSGRQRELAIRQAIGAGRGRIARQLLTESAVLGLLGGSVGLLLAFGGLLWFVKVLPPGIPRIDEVGVDTWVLGFTLAASTLTGLAFGAIPALRSSRSIPPSDLEAGGRGASAYAARAAALLVASEVASAVVLLVGAGLLIRSLTSLVAVDPGFRTERILTARITPPENRYADSARTRLFYEEVLTRVGALPGVEAVEAVSGLPLSGDMASFAFETEDNPSGPREPAPSTAERLITSGYLDAMDIPLLKGRPLTDADGAQAPRVALVNEAMAREHWPGEDPLGKRFKEVWLEEWTTVVGVVRDVKYAGLGIRVGSEIYRPFRQRPARDMSLVIRTSDEASTLAPSLREAVASVDATVPASQIRTANDLVSRSVAAPCFTTLLLATLAGVSLALAAVGIYGLLSYVVSRRTREIGIRMALGAGRGDVLRMVLRQALAPACAGTVIGIAGALAVTRVLDGLLFGVSATDGITFAVVPVLLVLVALLAAYLPASRATRVEPVLHIE
jgi:predicted permease